MRYLLYLDSRQSTGPRTSSCSFYLNQQLVNATALKVISFSFANTLYNVTTLNNTLVFDTLTDTLNVTLDPGFYSFSDLITAINTACLASSPFVSNLGGAPNAVVLNSALQAVWTIGSNILQSGSLYANFLLQPGTYTGNFTTTIFLASPLAIALQSNALSGPSRFVTCYPQPTTSYFYCQAIQSGYGDVEPANSSIQQRWEIPLSHNNLNTVDVSLFDPATNRELTEMSQWSLILEIDTKP